MGKCNHQWEFIEKWSDGKHTYWEFYCRKCLKISIIGNDGYAHSRGMNYEKVQAEKQG